MSELPSAYTPKNIEPKWREKWKTSGVFHADSSSDKPPFCVMMPPPNVTGTLHMGHALDTTLQDILVRWKKMSGYETLWLPGTDHAGIATQTVVERHLLHTEGKHRIQFSREEFLDHVWQWKEKSQKIILNQVEAIGCSCDWSKIRFSMDEQCSYAVRHMFKKLFDAGLIYRGQYLVNWDPVTGTALADDEVEYDERQGSLWTVCYPLAGEDRKLLVSTTRPETMLGDTAIAVHPHDERYHHLIGREVVHPITGQHIPVVADEFVEPEFGTGILKVTPAHDPIDYQLGQRRNLPMINILTKDARINENGGPFEGLTVQEAREAVVAMLKEKGCLERVDPYTHRVAVSYRSKAPIEPLLSEQWFVRATAFKETLKEYITSQKVRIIPKTWEHTYFQWIDNLRDWCISRQLWWGHRIPVWYHKENSELLICYEGEGIPQEVAEHPDMWEQDSDVLDTWFSSALWPFSTLGWPHKTADLEKFYPNTTLITGHDIIFFWVARMIMMGHVALGKEPFHETFLHGLIYGKSYWRDRPGGGITYVSPEDKKDYDLGHKSVPDDVSSKWEKMSKSKGNVLNPLDVIEEYGADAMRLALAGATTEASIIELDQRRFEEFQHFVNKIWNGARFVLTKLEGETFSSESEEHLALEDRWILSRLSYAAENLQKHLQAYAFDKAISTIYEFFWNEFCAFYIEIAKSSLSSSPAKRALCLTILINALRLLHPFAPYITEELFSLCKARFGNLERMGSQRFQNALSSLQAEFLCQTPFPESVDRNEEAEEAFQRIQNVLTIIRQIRGEMKIAPNIGVDLYFSGTNSSLHSLLQEKSDLLRSLVKINTIDFENKPPQGVVSHALIEDVELSIPLPEQLKTQELERLQKTIEKLAISCEKAQSQLEKLQKSEKTPTHVLERMQASLDQQEKEKQTAEEKLALLKT